MTTIGELAQGVIDALDSAYEDGTCDGDSDVEVLTVALLGALLAEGDLSAEEESVAYVETHMYESSAVYVSVGDKTLRVETDGTVEWVDEDA